MSLDQVCLGVDYGAAYTKAVVVWPDGRWELLSFDGAVVLPSAVHTGSRGGVLVGDSAWRHGALDGDGFVVSPLAVLGDSGGVVADGSDSVAGDLAAATLRRVAAAAVDRLGGVVGDVRLVVPAGWGPRRCTWLRHVAYEAGMGQPRLVPAPVAAAQLLIAAGVQVPVGAFLLICDLGAGCEVSVLRRGPAGFEVLSTLADGEAGGSGIDARLMAALAAPTETVNPGAAVGEEAAGGEKAAGIETPVDGDGRWWAQLASLRAAREALSQQVVVTVPMPTPAPPLVLHSRLVDELAEPVLQRAGDLAVRAVSAAELTADQLAGAYLIGGTAAMPAAAQVIGSRVGVDVAVVAQPGFAAVLGAADAGVYQPAASVYQPAAGEESVPPLRRLFVMLAAGIGSLGLFVHMVFTAGFYNGTRDVHRYGYYVLATWGELATAALFALLGCLAAGSVFGAALAQAQHRDGAATTAGHARTVQAVGAQAAGGLVLAVTAGLGIAAAYGVVAGVYFGLPVSQPLRWALLPILPTAVIVAAITWLARRRTPRSGWDAFLAFPVSSVVITAVGTVLLATWWGGPALAVLAGWTDAIGRAGGMLIGVGIACTLVRRLGPRLALSPFLAFFGFLVVAPGGTSILAVAYAMAVALWWAYRLWLLRLVPGDSHAR